MFPAKEKTCMENFRRSTAKIYWMNTTNFNCDPIYIRFNLCEMSWESGGFTLRKNCPYLELFWSAFSRIWTEYGEI